MSQASAFLQSCLLSGKVPEGLHDSDYPIDGSYLKYDSLAIRRAPDNPLDVLVDCKWHGRLVWTLRIECAADNFDKGGELSLYGVQGRILFDIR